MGCWSLWAHSPLSSRSGSWGGKRIAYRFGAVFATHYISVRASEGNKNSKDFSIFAPGVGLEQMHDIIRAFTADGLKKKLKEEIDFEEAPALQQSHRIIIIVKGQLVKNDSKSFSANFPSYSSLEIAAEIHRHLCGGFCHFGGDEQ